MLFKKIYVSNNSYMVYMWHFFFFGHVFAPLMAIFILVQFLNLNLFTKSKYWSFNLFAVFFILAYLIILVIWKKATFRRSNFIALSEKMGIKFVNKLYYYSLIEVVGVYSFARGIWNDIHIVAKLDLPFFAYAPWPRISVWKLVDKGKVTIAGGQGPDFMNEESRIELFSLIKGPYDVDVVIKLEDGKGEIPTTSCPEINAALMSHLADVSYFNGRLTFNGDCLRLAIIGGSWEGSRFGEKIQKGFEIFQQVNSALKAKYPSTPWNNFQVKWNRAEGIFYLMK